MGNYEKVGAIELVTCIFLQRGERVVSARHPFSSHTSLVKADHAETK